MDFLFGFTGRPYDLDTDLYDYRARWYDPEVGRWLTEDPAGFSAGDMNLYLYAGNSPVIYVDPSGMGYSGFWNAANAVAEGVGEAFGHVYNSVTGWWGGSSTFGQVYDSVNTAAGYLGGVASAAIDYAVGTNLVGMGSPTVSLAGGGQLMVTGSGAGTPFQQGVSGFRTATAEYTQQTWHSGQQAWETQVGGWAEDIAAAQIENRWRTPSSDASYLDRTLDSVIMGEYSEQGPTLASVGIGLVAGFFGADLPMDLRDLSSNIVNWESSWGHVGNTALNALGVLPVVGMAKNLKYVDNLADVGKNAGNAAGLAKNTVTQINVVGDTRVVSQFDTLSVAPSGFKPGTFSICRWTGYPSGIARPKGPFRLLEGAEYDVARKAANQANAALRQADPAKYAGKHIHEIHPVKYGGSPTDPGNKVALTPKQHGKYTTFWNRFQRSLEQ